MRAGEMGKPGKVNPPYLVGEFTYPILPPHQGGAMWFYSLPRHDKLCLAPERIYRDYAGAVKHGNIFSLDLQGTTMVIRALSATLSLAQNLASINLANGAMSMIWFLARSSDWMLTHSSRGFRSLILLPVSFT